MSLSKLTKIIVLSLALLTPASLAYAKTLVFQDHQWEVPFDRGRIVSSEIIRNDINLLDLAIAAITGQEMSQSATLLDQNTIKNIEQITKQINQEPHDPALIIKDDHHAQEFDPGQNGQSLDLYDLHTQLTSDTERIQLSVMISEPHALLSETNTLGINELVAEGKSDFSGSPANRIHNIKVGAGKFNGLIVARGEEFSFNKYLGEVDDVHGFLPELVIKPEGVTPEFGGGLCQVSTTTFRAAMNAGLPITARRNHSFAVQYYAPQGSDATIYPGSSDLKFVNNLRSALLIQTRIEGRKLYFDFYGTKDDRIVSFEGPVQYDKKSDGSMKATWTRHVTLDGKTSDQTFKSTYLPPALFHHDVVEPNNNPTLTQTPPTQ
jgi:vancomycin resistance protein YoaR